MGGQGRSLPCPAEHSLSSEHSHRWLTREHSGGLVQVPGRKRCVLQSGAGLDVSREPKVFVARVVPGSPIQADEATDPTLPRFAEGPPCEFWSQSEGPKGSYELRLIPFLRAVDHRKRPLGGGELSRKERRFLCQKLPVINWGTRNLWTPPPSW